MMRKLATRFPCQVVGADERLAGMLELPGPRELAEALADAAEEAPEDGPEEIAPDEAPDEVADESFLADGFSSFGSGAEFDDEGSGNAMGS